MCGIAVYLGPRDHPYYTRRHQMLECLRHRGPDDRSEREINVGGGRVLWLGHTRLAILDLTESGRQPMADPVTGTLVAYNGELYNYRELGQGLRSKGVKLRTNCDTEVLLAAYRIWKRDSLRHLRGMFAFVLWDAHEKILWCARDPFGIKPLYAHEKEGAWLIASEASAIAKARGDGCRPNRRALAEFFEFGAPHSPRTLFEGIESFRPGEARVISPEGRPVQSMVLTLPPVERQDEIYDEKVLRRRIENAFAAAVERHLVSDVPVGLFLSGGLDSSMIAAVMAEDLGRKPDCYTVGFAGAESAWDESEYARLVAKRWGAPHVEVRLGEDEILGQVEAGLAAMDQPTIDGLNTFIVAGAFHRSGGKVALSGLGADELFGGYGRLRALPSLQRILNLPASLRRAAASLLPGDDFSKTGRLRRLLKRPHADPTAIYLALREVWPAETVATLLSAAAGATRPSGAGNKLQAVETPSPTLDGVTRLEFEYYLPDVLLRDADVMGMAHSLEIRVPYLDFDFVRVTRSLPLWARFGGGFAKSILVENRLKPLGRAFLLRRKTGFMLPFDRWLRGPLRSMAESLSGDMELQQRAGLAPERVEHWTRMFFDRHALHWSRFWAILVYLHWARKNGAAP